MRRSGRLSALLVLLAAAVAHPAPARAGWPEASAAWARGDFAAFARELLPLAEAGDPSAQLELGNAYREGEGVPQDFAEAARWWREAAEQGLAQAQFNLGMLYDQGRGVPQDVAEAARWYRKGAEQGDARAMNNLGVAYEFSRGVPRDLVRAHMWYNLAASREQDPQERERAARNRDDVAARLAPAELARAQALARAWRPGMADEPPPVARATPPESAPPPAPGSAMPAEEPARVAEAQRLLAILGFDPGPVDGVVGARTRAAVRAFQRQAGLVETGEIDELLLAALRLALAVRDRPRPTEPRPSADPGRTASSGSGFWVSAAGQVLTNRHVVEGCRTLAVRDAAGAVHPARLAAVAREDLALLTTGARPAEVAGFRGGRAVRIGEPVVAYGFPLAGLLASEGNLVTGTVAALAVPGDDPALLQITAPVQAGNSGGPVLDAQGRVVGVVVAKLDALKVAGLTGDLPQNVNFAIKAQAATSFLEARGVEPEISAEGRALTPEELAARARALAVRVDCGG